MVCLVIILKLLKMANADDMDTLSMFGHYFEMEKEMEKMEK